MRRVPADTIARGRRAGHEIKHFSAAVTRSPPSARRRAEKRAINAEHGFTIDIDATRSGGTASASFAGHCSFLRLSLGLFATGNENARHAERELFISKHFHKAIYRARPKRRCDAYISA